MQVIAPRRVHVPTLPRLPRPLRWLADAFARTSVVVAPAVSAEPAPLPEQHPALPWWFDQALM